MLVRYQGRIVGLIGATRFCLAPDLQRGVDRQRVTAVCQWALEMRHQTGYEPGRLPSDLPHR
jgi:hypothetical protein